MLHRRSFLVVARFDVDQALAWLTGVDVGSNLTTDAQLAAVSSI